jgi:O-antigen/teichoic acid export membrane protein
MNFYSRLVPNSRKNERTVSKPEIDMKENNENQKSLASQSAWLLFAKLVGFILSFILPLLIFRTLSKNDIGIYNQVFLIIGTAGSVLPFGVSMSAFYFLSREKERRPYFISNILLFNFIVGGLTCLTMNLFPEIIGGLFKDAEMTRLAPQIGFVVWLWLFSSFLETAAIANQEARLAMVFIICSQLTKTILMVAAVLIFGTVDALLNAISFQVVLQALILLVYLNSRFPKFWKFFDLKILKEHLKYAIPFGLVGILWVMQTDIHNYFIANRFSPEEVAVYRAGCFELPLLNLFYESISSVMIPRMSELQSKGKIREMLELMVRAMEKLSLFYFPAFVFFTITSYTLITTLFTSKFADSVPIFAINVLLLPFYIFVSDPIVRSFSSVGKFILKVRILMVGLLIITLFYGIQHFNLQGMITIVFISSIADRLISFVKVSKTVGAKLSDIYLLKRIGATALVSFVIGIPTYFFYLKALAISPPVADRLLGLFIESPKLHVAETLSGFITLFFTGLIFAILYFIGVVYLKVLTDEEKDFIFTKVTKVFHFFKTPKLQTLD